jgi:hypothetical protein
MVRLFLPCSSEEQEVKASEMIASKIIKKRGGLVG